MKQMTINKKDMIFVNWLWDLPNVNIAKVKKEIRRYNKNKKKSIELECILSRATKKEAALWLSPSEYKNINPFIDDKFIKIPHYMNFVIPKE